MILSLGFIGVRILPDSYRFLSIGALGIITAVLFVWSLREGLGLNLTLLSLILPTFFTLGVGLFWFLLPSSVFARIPIIILYGLGIYTLCLTTNIYTVAAVRTIALLRAARGVGFVLTLLTLFLTFDTILSFRWPIYITSPFVLLSAFFLYYQGFWAVSLKKEFTVKELSVSLVSSIVMAEVALALFFWPVTVVVGSLFLTVTAYILLGLGQAYLEERLFSQTIREYLLVGLAVFIGMLLATNWGR
ncbi:hypothetical protein A2714_01985 [Candidatus Woesebacteria bacterium RIFCSPHIGHO2_01_FULL_38_9]|uniref:Uncharacterized protein n=1 Tax=Candidatus Woesebacteria bacterium RIFCSPHIGHO2_01_FULL_38_9 TaxID=1802492 RepID=A0A1F7Y2D9_9BACT|nr:MAG: hypothetical protein A2714_01985 [Candidatus Woesebacteria bacterium RIFCSPHIGHO2_01_FULL_38_9]